MTGDSLPYEGVPTRPRHDAREADGKTRLSQLRSRRRQAREVHEHSRSRRGENPALVLARSGCASPTRQGSFRAQLRACCARRSTARARSCSPMISGVAELRMLRAVVERVKADLRTEASRSTRSSSSHHDRDAGVGAHRGSARRASATSSDVPPPTPKRGRSHPLTRWRRPRDDSCRTSTSPLHPSLLR